MKAHYRALTSIAKIKRQMMSWIHPKPKRELKMSFVLIIAMTFTLIQILYFQRLISRLNRDRRIIQVVEDCSEDILQSGVDREPPTWIHVKYPIRYCPSKIGVPEMVKKKKVLKRDLWVDVNERLPKEYQLVKLRYNSKCCQPGWWTGNGWDAGKGLLKGKVVEWQRLGGHVVDR